MSIYTAGGCQDCGREDGLDFLVATPLWNLVLAGEEWPEGKDREGVGGVLCLACFDSRACAAGVEYRDHLVVLGRHSWMAGTYDGGIPELEVDSGTPSRWMLVHRDGKPVKIPKPKEVYEREKDYQN